MRDMVRRFRTDNTIRRFVGQLVRDIDPRDHFAKVERIFRFVADRILFLDDPGGEHVAAPVDVLQTMVGDCDCKATLLATLLEAAGLPTQLVFMPGHVFVEVQLTDGDRVRLPVGSKFRPDGQHVWVPLESTGNGNPMGWIDEQRWNEAVAAGRATALRI
jgi:transglutaminase-like putative cysteine protease